MIAMLLRASCIVCGLPVPHAPEVKAMCKVCDAGTKRMQQARPDWICEVVRRLESR